jgi:hypothetical protein
MLPALVRVFQVETFLRLFGGAMTAASAPFRASLWKSWAFVACGAVWSCRWKFARNIRSLFFFFFIVVVVLWLYSLISFLPRREV